MNLEDHPGDIIRKARAMSGVSAAAAASAAGISETELSALEETGRKRPDGRISRRSPSLVGLNAAKLEGIADGWHPTEKDLSPWRELRVITTASRRHSR